MGEPIWTSMSFVYLATRGWRPWLLTAIGQSTFPNGPTQSVVLWLKRAVRPQSTIASTSEYLALPRAWHAETPYCRAGATLCTAEDVGF